MTTFERRQRILGLLRERPGIKVTELAPLLGVSEGTIRNDLTALADGRQLTRVRDGAVITDDHAVSHPTWASRARVHALVKQKTARRAADLIEDGDAIFLDASSTVYTLVRFLQTRRSLSVVTNGIDVARALAHNPSDTVIVVGDVLSSEGTSVAGLLNEQLLRDLHIKTAFVSCNGFSLGGLTEVDIHEAQIKRRMIASAESVVALIDASKFGKVDLAPFAQQVRLGLEQAAAAQKDADIPVIAVDIPLPGTIFFGAGHHRAGCLAGEGLGRWILEHWQGYFDCLICLRDTRAGATSAARMQGGRDGLESVLGPVLRRRYLAFIGYTSYAPENNGEQLLELAINAPRGEPVLPATYCTHRCHEGN